MGMDQGLFGMRRGRLNGSGSSANKDDDLLCISTTPVEKDAQVVFEGTIAVDRNVGMGVQPVVLDQASTR